MDSDHVSVRGQRMPAEAGNTLILFPAAVLIVVGLGALALDSATLFLGQRRLADLAAAVANDVVAGIDVESFYDPDRELRIDDRRAVVRSSQLVAGQSEDRSFESVRCEVVTAGLEATVTCRAQVRPIFAPLWPGMSTLQEVLATETAIGVQR